MPPRPLSPRPRRLALAAAGLCAALGTACGAGEPDPARAVEEPARRERTGSPTARPELLEQFRADLAAERHPADGGGRAWLVLGEGETGAVEAGGVGTWSFVYEAGPEGIRPGGALYFQVSPFWGWSSPQTDAPDRAGYTTVACSAEDVALDARAVGASPPRLVRVEIAGRALREGERIRLTYGAGPMGAVADRNAERRSVFWFAVDGDGDGVRALVEDCPTIEVLAGPPGMLVASVTSVVPPGGLARLTLAVLDVAGNAGRATPGRVVLSVEPEGLELPEAVELVPEDRGRKTVELGAGDEGVFRVRATLELDGRTLEATGNPLWVSAARTAVYWGDLHGHSAFSDGTGTPDDYFAYAREVAGLDVAVLTDHDHFGMRFLDANPRMWEEILAAVRDRNEPGRFVTLLGYEWTSWLYGHRHVLYFQDDAPVRSSIDPAFETPALLWEALRGEPALTFAHHSAGGPVATDWSYAPDPVLEPLTEIVSAHGSSEAADSPARIYSAVPGNYVRDALDRGYRLGFVGSGDGHDGHPGLTHLAPIYGYRPARPGGGGLPRMGNGGLAAIRADELTRPALLAAMRERRVYATSGPRILLECAWNGRRMGSTIPTAELAAPTRLAFRASGTAPLARADVVRSGQVIASLDLGGLLDVGHELELPPAQPGEYVYVRLVQADGGLAWSSPFFVE